MSNWREQLSEESESKAVAVWLQEYFHYPVLVVLIVFAFWNRIRNWSNFVVDGTVFYGGNDPWYHIRSTEYVVENGLSTMPFDPWTGFSFGTSTGQFGTLFDQIIGFVALVVGLGNPSESLVRHIFLVAPAFFGIAATIPAYLIGRRLGGRFGGVVSVGFIAFAPDRFLQVSIAGSTQHEVAEPLLMSLGILGLMVALTVAEREKPVYELVAAGNISALRGTAGWSMLSGIAIGMYLWTWPPGVWIFGIIGTFFVIHLSLQHLRGESPEHAAFVGVISLATAGFMALSAVATLDLSPTSKSILQPALAFFVVGGIVFMAWLSREVDSRDLSPYAYPGSVLGIMVVGAAFMALVLPDTFYYLVGQVDRVLGFFTSTSQSGATIGEFQPPSSRLDYLYNRYWFGIVTALVGALIILARQTMPERAKGEELLIVVWIAFLIAATWTQQRFGYYLTIPVGALNAMLIGFLMKLLGSRTDQEFSIETYQVLTVAMVILLMFVPLLGVPLVGADNTAYEQADQQSRPGGVVAWNDGLEWMSENTPQEGQYANPDGEPMDLFGTFDRTEDYDYPDGAYGVLSWWDYGHWITAQGERIPNANPFQQGATDAAYFLLAQSEEEALNELEQRFDEDENAQTQYVTIDWKMAESEALRPYVNGKFFAPIEFHSNYTREDFYQPVYLTNPQDIQNRRQLFTQRTIAHNQPYYESMVTRLYDYHGSAREPSPIGIQRRGTAQGQSPIEGFQSLSEAREWADQRGDRTVGGVGLNPTERVEALEHFRLVHVNNVSSIVQGETEQQLRQEGVYFGQQSVVARDLQGSGIRDAYLPQVAEDPSNPTDQELQRATLRAQQALTGSNPAWTKTFERVPGATINIEGGPANEQLTVSVPIKPANGNEFTYTQRVETDASGAATTTVPYATEGYDEYGVEEGYTDTNVRATGNYSIRTQIDIQNIDLNDENTTTIYQGSADVTEAQVIGEDDSAVDVTLAEQSILQQQPVDENSTSDGQ